MLVTEAMGALGARPAPCSCSTPPPGGFPAAAVGMANTARDRLATLPVDAPIPVAAVVRLGEPLWLETQSSSPRAFRSCTTSRRERMGALAALPLKIGECVLGAVTFGFDAARAFSPGSASS